MRIETFKGLIIESQRLYDNSWRSTSLSHRLSHEQAVLQAIKNRSRRSIISERWVVPIAMLNSECWTDIQKWAHGDKS